MTNNRLRLDPLTNHQRAFNDQFETIIYIFRNAPSPAATSSLAIANLVVDKMEELWRLEQI